MLLPALQDGHFSFSVRDARYPLLAPRASAARRSVLTTIGASGPSRCHAKSSTKTVCRLRVRGVFVRSVRGAAELSTGAKPWRSTPLSVAIGRRIAPIRLYDLRDRRGNKGLRLGGFKDANKSATSGVRHQPDEFGPWQTVWKRHRRFAADGTWDWIHPRLLADAGAGWLGRAQWTPLSPGTPARDEPSPGHRGTSRITL